MSDSICQDIANDLATAVRKRYVELVAFAGLPMAFKANNVEMLPEHMEPYREALNQANSAVWKVLWRAYKEHCILHSPGKVPQATYDPNKRCDNRCWSAKGYDCSCKCMGSFHGMGEEAVKLAMSLS